MHPQLLKTCAIALFASLALGTAGAADTPEPSEKWRIQIQGAAKSAGQFQFRITPHEGEAMVVTTEISQGRGVLAMTKYMLESFKKQLPMKRFKSETLANQDLLLRPRAGEQAFVLELVEESVDGARVLITRE
jgi:hypothetical protein